MRIPGGDLAPAHRRRYGGSYGRRRHRRTMRRGVALVLLVVAGGAAYALRVDGNKTPRRLATTPACATTKTTTTPQPQQVRLVLLNGTPRNGLAKRVGDGLSARGFVVTAQANAPSALAGRSEVVWGPGAQPSATLVVRHVLGSRAVSNPRARHGSVQVVLGSEFHRLATPAEVAAAGRTPPATGAGSTTRGPACAS